MRALVWVALLLVPTAALAEKVDRSMVVLDFAPQTPDDKARAQAVTALVSAELSKRPGAKLVTAADVAQVLGVERQRQLLGCTESGCIAELGGALGTRYILSGQVGRLGGKILLSASVTDARTARSIARLAHPLANEDELITGANALAGEVASAIGLLDTTEDVNGRGANIDLKLGNTLPSLTGSGTSLRTFNLRLDFEVGYFVTEQTSPFLGASLSLAHGSATGESLTFIPVLIGVKHYFRPERLIQPYVGGGVGLGFLSGTLGKNDGSSKTSFALTGVAGLAYLPWRHAGFNVEASGNLSGVSVRGSSLLLAFNLDAGLLFIF